MLKIGCSCIARGGVGVESGVGVWEVDANGHRATKRQHDNSTQRVVLHAQCQTWGRSEKPGRQGVMGMTGADGTLTDKCSEGDNNR